MEKLDYPQPMVGRKCYEVYHNREVPCEVCPTRETLRTGKVWRTIRNPVNAPKKFIEIQTFPLINRTSGRVEGVIEHVRDVTETRRAQEERLQLSNLESLATLAGGIAHDFNNILTAILGNIGLAGLESRIPTVAGRDCSSRGNGLPAGPEIGPAITHLCQGRGAGEATGGAGKTRHRIRRHYL